MKRRAVACFPTEPGMIRRSHFKKSSILYYILYLQFVYVYIYIFYTILYYTTLISTYTMEYLSYVILYQLYIYYTMSTYTTLYLHNTHVYYTIYTIHTTYTIPYLLRVYIDVYSRLYYSISTIHILYYICVYYTLPAMHSCLRVVPRGKISHQDLLSGLSMARTSHPGTRAAHCPNDFKKSSTRMNCSSHPGTRLLEITWL